MMYNIANICTTLEALAPLHLQESYDNCGLLVGDREAPLSRVLVSLDVTEAVVDEAKRLGAELIVAHHPIIFRGLKSLTGKNYVERTIINAIQNKIGIYAIHTNLDNIITGVNAKICERLGLQNLRILAAKQNDKPDIGSGMLAELPSALPSKDFFDLLKEKMQLKAFKHTDLVKDKIQKVAVCGGSGSFLLSRAIQEQADIFITADFKYHEFFDAENKIIIADIGHYESEIFTCELLRDFIVSKLGRLDVLISEVNTNPVSYYF